MKKNIDVSEEKVSALEMYLAQKGTDLDAELTQVHRAALRQDCTAERP